MEGSIVNNILKLVLNALIMTLIVFVYYGCGQGKKFVLFSIVEEKSENTNRVTEVDSIIHLGLFGGKGYIMPLNSYMEWSGYPFIFEKRYENYYQLKNQPAMGNLPERPVWIHTGPIINVYDGTFKNWIYLHSEGSLDYDISDMKAVKFSAYVGLANPWYLKDFDACGNNGSVRIIFQVNGRLLYDTGIMKGVEQQSPIHVEFDIPVFAKTLTINVSDGGDGIGCDHWTMGDAKITHIEKVSDN